MSTRLGGRDVVLTLETVTPTVNSFEQQAGSVSFEATRMPSSEKYDPTQLVFDPTSDGFDQEKFVRAIAQAMDEQGIEVPRLGLRFEGLSVSGSGSSLKYQDTVSSPFTSVLGLRTFFQTRNAAAQRIILHDFDGLLNAGELLLVLGRPGSGCTTFLKALCGLTQGTIMTKESVVEYNGIPSTEIEQSFKGFVAYNAESDIHFPHLTVGETLEFAAASRAPHRRLEGVSRRDYVKTAARATMSVFGLSHTYNIKVGNNFIRGVSGGERKRVSIAEMFLSRVRFAAWDNSTRGLDSATAFSFVKSLRRASELSKSSHAVAAYQASQAMYDVFDKVIVLYDGREVFYGSTSRAVDYFVEMGWERPKRQVAGEYLTAVTNPQARKACKGMVHQVPRTADEFYQYWKLSSDYAHLKHQMDQYSKNNQSDVKAMLTAAKSEMQANHARQTSPYIISVPMQIRLCLKRAFQRIRNEKAAILSPIMAQVVLSLILGSVFFNSPNNTAGLFQKAAVLFFAILMNGLITMNEIIILYAQRPIVEKQASYAFVHPFTEAIASMAVDVPFKLFRCSIFGIILYFMTNMRREVGSFFIFYLFLLMAVFTMSGIFRTVAAATKTVSQAMSIAGVMVLAIVMYTGFTLPVPYMRVWFSWFRWINPIFYAFEALMVNEFHGRDLACASFVPANPDFSEEYFICSVVGAVAGQITVSGDAFMERSYEYYHSHLWRNFGIMIVFLIFFSIANVILTEINSSSNSKAEFLVFRHGHKPQSKEGSDEEAQITHTYTQEANKSTQKSLQALTRQHDFLTFKDLVFEVPTKEGSRRLLDNVCGYVKPGTLTALMGVSGAGKTTLLDVLADRTQVGVITGDIFINNRPRAADFQRETGYVQQQDLHLETATVREALQFAALLRQSKTTSKKDKYAYVEEVIAMLGMEAFAEAVIGIPGEGLNVEQRKLLSIGVELAAKPKLLLFLDEPTSGLDSQSSWAICQLLRSLADHGQAVLCTIHQPSALLFQKFDRLLLLDKSGKTSYFGDIGHNSTTLTEYFQQNGARLCGAEENPAEYMLEVLQHPDDAKIDWPSTWISSSQAYILREEIDSMNAGHLDLPKQPSDKEDKNHTEFAMPVWDQFIATLYRALQAIYRTPEYVYAKLALAVFSSLLVGFTFWQQRNTQQGFQNTLFSLFILCTIFGNIVNQTMPRFVAQRELYEVRERPSKTYSWKAFILAQLISELPWQMLMAILAFLSYYWSIFGTDQDSERRGLILLYMIQFYIFASSFAHLVISALPDAATGGMIATLCFGLTLIFSGVLQPPGALPGFWIFMYRVSPLTYYISGLASTALSGRSVQCANVELSHFNPPPGQTCSQYLATFLQTAPGSLYNPDATSDCQYCSLSFADQYLSGREIYWKYRWRNYGIFWTYFVFNIFGAIILYYFFRVRVNKRKKI